MGGTVKRIMNEMSSIKKPQRKFIQQLLVTPVLGCFRIKASSGADCKAKGKQMRSTSRANASTFDLLLT